MLVHSFTFCAILSAPPLQTKHNEPNARTKGGAYFEKSNTRAIMLWIMGLKKKPKGDLIFGTKI